MLGSQICWHWEADNNLVSRKGWRGRKRKKQRHLKELFVLSEEDNNCGIADQGENRES